MPQQKYPPFYPFLASHMLQFSIPFKELLIHYNFFNAKWHNWNDGRFSTIFVVRFISFFWAARRKRRRQTRNFHFPRVLHRTLDVFMLDTFHTLQGANFLVYKWFNRESINAVPI